MDSTQLQSYHPGDEHSLTQEKSRDLFTVGQWYWCKGVGSSYRPELHITRMIDDETYCLLCLVHIGSNVVKLSEPRSNGSTNIRLLLSAAHERLILEPNYQQVIQQEIDKKSLKTRLLLEQISKQAQRFGITVSQSVINYATPHALPAPTSANTGLAILSDVLDVAEFKQEMVLFQKTTLPTLQEDVKRQSEGIAKWAAAANLIPSIMIDQLTDDMDKITDKIEDISLYAGIEETMTLVKEGAAASENQPIHIMQRKLFMDEECLVDYDAGGMSFDDISEFDAWLCRHGNMERLLPFEKTVVAFQIRRSRKEYDSTLHPFITIRLHKLDKLTVLYVRNGEQLYRVSSQMMFDDMIFPSNQGMLNEPVMVKMFCDRVSNVITMREYQQVKDHLKQHGAQETEKVCGYQITGDIARNEYLPFDDQHLFFDEVNRHFTNILKQYNKVAIVLQGILDRSEALNPHPRINLSNPTSFMNHIRLIYDAEHVLYSGDKPDFEAYRNELNQQITDDSVFVGQYEAFIRRETEKENNNRLSSRYRDELCEINRYVPSGNPGPGKISLAAKVMKTGKVIFTWHRESKTDWTKLLKDSITVPTNELLNASAYHQGDYKRFFADPRTREEYLKWAPFLLKAEDYVSGVEAADKPV